MTESEWSELKSHADDLLTPVEFIKPDPAGLVAEVERLKAENAKLTLESTLIQCERCSRGVRNKYAVKGLCVGCAEAEIDQLGQTAKAATQQHDEALALHSELHAEIDQFTGYLDTLDTTISDALASIGRLPAPATQPDRFEAIATAAVELHGTVERLKGEAATCEEAHTKALAGDLEAYLAIADAVGITGENCPFDGGDLQAEILERIGKLGRDNRDLAAANQRLRDEVKGLVRGKGGAN